MQFEFSVSLVTPTGHQLPLTTFDNRTEAEWLVKQLTRKPHVQGLDHPLRDGWQAIITERPSLGHY
jgi:hypothetical protein